MAINKVQFRRFHYMVAPFMFVPLVLTLMTGSLYQIAKLTGNIADFIWLIDIHKGKFGPVNLEIVYPFLNAFGALFLAVTGIVLWWTAPQRRQKKRS